MINISFKMAIRSSVMLSLVILGMIFLRLSVDQIQWYNIATGKMDANDKMGSIMYFDRVLNAHIPFSPIEKKTRRHLLNLASDFEKTGKYETALFCYETIRTSQYLTKSFYLPFNNDIAFLNARIASLKADLLIKEGIVNDAAAEYKHQMEILQKDFSPALSMALITTISFFAYITSILIWILSNKIKYIFISCMSFVVWAITLYMV